MRAWISIFLLLALPAMAGAETWALLGLRGVDGPLLGDTLQAARAAFAAHLPEGDRMLSGEESLRGFGLGRVSIEALEAALTEAELLFFQLEYEAARAKLQSALVDLGRDRGQVPVELGRRIRILLALILLQESGGRDEAAEVLRPLAALASLPDSERETTPESVALLWDELRAAAAARAEGWLVVDCTGCHGGEVLLEGMAVGTTQQSIGLAPGSYRLVLRGLAGSEGRRSLAREVRIRSGEETRMRIDLAAESALVEDGPSLVGAGESTLERAARLAELFEVDRLLIWSFSERSEEVRVWEASASGLRGPWSRKGWRASMEEAVEELAQEILGGGEAEEFAPADHSLFSRQEEEAGWGPAAKWTALGATVALIGSATWLTLDTSLLVSEFERLDRVDGYRSVQEGRRAEALSGAIGTRRAWNAALWTGAAVGAAASLFLFLDASLPERAFVDGASDGR